MQREDVARLFAPAVPVERHLETFVRGFGLAQPLTDAILYSLLAPGKRLRPVLTWHCCAAAGAPGQAAVEAAAAIELVHCFSLVHDDLPALDNDDLRRGMPTLHRHAGEAMAILAGDAMLALAFAAVSRARASGVADLLAELSGATAMMVSGQVFDTLGGLNAGATPVEKLREIHRNKTGALIRAACRMGVIAAYEAGGDGLGVPRDRALKAVTTYADAVGLAFQIVDDLLDVTQSTEHAGKRTGKDAAAGKLTYPAAIGVEASRSEVLRLRDEAKESLGVFGEAGRPLADLCEYLCVRTR